MSHNPNPASRHSQVRRTSSHRGVIIAVVIALALAVIVVGLTVLSSNRDKPPAVTLDTATPLPAPSQPQPPTDTNPLTAEPNATTPTGTALPTTPGPQAPGPAVTGPVGTATFRPATLGFDSPEIPNPGRGQYLWLDQPATPPGWPLPDMYLRDYLQWGKDLEPVRGQYNFSTLETALARAKARGGRLGFRIMAYCPGCGEVVGPSYIPRQAGGAPDWNSEAFLSGWDGLWKALGQRYANDPRIGYIDFGGYGMWGEWWCDPGACGTAITDANARRLMKAVVDAFPTKPKLINMLGNYPEIATSLSTTVGQRMDCVGGVDEAGLPPSGPVRDTWKYAPTVGEWCRSSNVNVNTGMKNVKDLHMSLVSSSNFPFTYNGLSPTDQRTFREINMIAGYRYSLSSLNLPRTVTPGSTLNVTSQWHNAGVAPTYDRWSVTLRLSDPSGKLAWSQPLGVDLRQVLPGTRTDMSTLRMAALTPGPYTVSVRISDPSGYFTTPLRLANSQRQPDGSYRLGQIIVGIPTAASTRVP